MKKWWTKGETERDDKIREMWAKEDEIREAAKAQRKELKEQKFDFYLICYLDMH